MFDISVLYYNMHCQKELGTKVTKEAPACYQELGQRLD